VLAGPDVLGSLEHHVFEQVSEPRSPGPLVRGADVVVHGNRDRRRRVILGDDDAETVLEFDVTELHGARGVEGHHRGQREDERHRSCSHVSSRRKINDTATHAADAARSACDAARADGRRYSRR
jgi:hypothetical protein